MDLDLELERVAELLFTRKRRELSELLDQCRAEAGDATAGLSGRADLLSAYQRAFELHCRKVLEDYLVVLTLFDGLGHEGASLESVYERHVNESASALIGTLNGAGQAERNRIGNAAAALKVDARSKLQSAVRSWVRATAHRRVAAAPADLDDRLPLNRRARFDRDLLDETDRARREGEPVALVMMDIDHFKKVNDEHGHPVGDEVLMVAAERVIARLGLKGRAYRYGGEEIALLLPGYSAEEACGLAERIRKDLEAAPMSSKGIHVTASFGAACFPDQSSSTSQLLEVADAALYEAKENGRNRVCQAP